jgi:hypothetical protein
LLLSTSAEARIWRVARDGSGDFTRIQPAIDAASPGDTLSIGAGKYTEFTSVRLPGWPGRVLVYAHASKADLTLIGDDPETVVIGPETANFSDDGPYGIAGVRDHEHLRIEGVQVRNVQVGILSFPGQLEIEDCQLAGCEIGVITLGADRVRIESCRFEECTDQGAYLQGSCDDAVIQDSCFLNCAIGILLGLGVAATMSSCEIRGNGMPDACDVGIKCTAGSAGDIRDCEVIDPLNAGIVVQYGSTATLSGCELSGGQWNVRVSGGSEISGTGNIFWGGLYTTILDDGCQMYLHGNHILNAGGMSVLLGDGWDYFPAWYLDLSENYWGTTDWTQIVAWIWDWHDDPAISGFVLYDPFILGPIGTEQQSWGQVKAFYR